MPWGPDIFSEARDRDRPILLSVGYSACHWCHVMAHESFEDLATAKLMNELFVTVKVDREERPDVDAIYMEAVQAMTGQGGWPMTVFLTPDGHPFFGGTYYPPTRRGNMPSFTELMKAVDDAWTNRRDAVIDQAQRLGGSLRSAVELPADGDQTLPTIADLESAADQFIVQFDPEWGGFGNAPKFPAAMGLDAMLRIHRHFPDPAILGVVTTSLDAMASGGIYDQLGGGFSRYSVDRQWLVPHFEKMLYDNALLARVYLHAWQETGDERYLQVLEETIDYVLRDLRHPSGGFCSAEDADSEGVEGRFYVWSDAELRAICSAAGVDPDTAAQWWGVTPAGNFEGSNILHRPVRADILRTEEIETARVALLAARNQRVRPGLDDKILTEWNALFLSVLAESAAATGRDDWSAPAVDNATFLVDNLRRADGRWLRSWQSDPGDHSDGRARHLAYAHDHGALIDAFTRVAELTGEAIWITHATETADSLIELFSDPDNGGFFTTGNDAEALIKRPKDIMDNATPSAQSLAAVGLLRLGALTGNNTYEDAARRILGLLGHLVSQHPTGFGHLIVAADLESSGMTELAIVGDRPDLVDVVREAWRPDAVLAWGEPYSSPLWADRSPGHAYVCRNYACQSPVDSPESLRNLLDQ